VVGQIAGTKCDPPKGVTRIATDKSPCRDFPYNTMEYAQTYRGEVLFCRSISSAIFIRRIAGTDFLDGSLPWPYVTLPKLGEPLIKKELPELITLTGVVEPSGTCPSSMFAEHELVPFKEHFVFEPFLGPIDLSKKSSSNLRKGAKVWHVADANSGEGWRAFAELYRKFVLEKDLTGGFYDLGDEHFCGLSGISSMRLFGVKSPSAWGAMACGARHRGELHLLHTIVSSHGYKSYASYVLMDEITRYCAANGLTLFIGGQPRGAEEGLLRFKKRWTNKSLPAWLLKIVLRPDIYRRLAIPGNQFFPGYRLPNSTICPANAKQRVSRRW